MHLLDTNILTAFHKGNPKITAALNVLDEPQIATTIVNQIELIQGRTDFLLKAENGDRLLYAQSLLRETEYLLAEIQIIPFNEAAAAYFDQLKQQSVLRKSGRPDLLIASVALANRATLVTRNLKDFKNVPNLKPAQYSKMSYTVIRSPRIQGLPLRFPGSIVIKSL